MIHRRFRPLRRSNQQARVVADLIEEAAMLQSNAASLTPVPRPAAAEAPREEIAAPPPSPSTPPTPVETAPEPIAAVPAPPVPEPDRYRTAREAVERGEVRAALAAYRALLAVTPSDTIARAAAALLLEQAGDKDNALAELDTGLELAPDADTLLVQRASLLCAFGRYAAADRDLRRVLRNDPGDVNALWTLGVLLSRKGLWAQAVPQLQRAVELDPSRGPAWFYLGEALNHVDDLPGALAAYERAAQLLPENPKPLYGLGIVLDRLNRPEDAQQVYRRSREMTRR